MSERASSGPRSESRDIEIAAETEAISSTTGRRVIAAIGIDYYQSWPRLTNAVSDARSVLGLFEHLGFEQVSAPLFDGAATGKALQELVMDDLRVLGSEDSLVLFYAGHGGTRPDRIGSQEVKTGYLVPSDASDKAATWVELEGWLRAVARLPAKHILVILDACHSGIALGGVIKWRDTKTWQEAPLSTLQMRQSRRIITSALDNQTALDSGPMHGHSLFTGCLIEGLTCDLTRGGVRVTSGSELGLYLQRRVAAYPHSRQTPDFGTFDFDDRGELLLSFKSNQVKGSANATPCVPASAVMSVISNSGYCALPLAPSSGLAPSPPVGYPGAQQLPLQTGLKPKPDAPSSLRQSASNRSHGWMIFAGGATALAFVLMPVMCKSRGGNSSPHSSNPIDNAPTAAELSVRLSDPRDEAKAGIAGIAPTNCPADMLRVPPGSFRMGSPEREGQADEHPQHTVTLSGYCIDRTEVTVKLYAACVAAKGCATPQLTVNLNRVGEEVKQQNRHCNGEDRAAHPMNCVDWEQAAAYCHWAGRRLPTEAEWEYAARGNDGRMHPWGNAAPSAKFLNGCGSECTALESRDKEQIGSPMYAASDGWKTTAPVGSFPDGKSPFGVLDTAGNVREWTSDWYGSYSVTAVENPQGANAGRYRVSRGSGWYHNDATWVRATVRSRNEPSYRNNGLGFRCARE